MSNVDQRLSRLDAAGWQASWDRQQDHSMPDREQRFVAMLDVVEAVAGPEPLVLDLACGTGSITARLLDRLPGARSVAVDVDPALLAIAAATFADDARVRIVRADLADLAWSKELGTEPFDAVLTATALHWLPSDVLRRLYRDLFPLVGPGGLVINADHMPDPGLPTVSAALGERDRSRRHAASAHGDPDWDTWWESARSHPQLRPLVAERDRRFGGNHAPSFSPPATWHLDALRAAGFTEVGLIWRGGNDAAVAALRPDTDGGADQAS